MTDIGLSVGVDEEVVESVSSSRVLEVVVDRALTVVLWSTSSVTGLPKISVVSDTVVDVLSDSLLLTVVTVNSVDPSFVVGVSTSSVTVVVTAHKSTAVTHTVVGNFTSPTDLNLIVGKHTRIEVSSQITCIM